MTAWISDIKNRLNSQKAYLITVLIDSFLTICFCKVTILFVYCVSLSLNKAIDCYEPFRYYCQILPVGSEAYRILVIHSRSVADKALAIARMHPEMNLDLTFVEEAAMLHDIGIFRCNAPDIDCHGDAEYICHGYLGAN